MKISRQRLIKASPQAIWGLIAPVERIPEWLSGAETAQHASGPAEGVGRRQRVATVLHGLDVEIDQEVIAWERNKTLGVRYLRQVSQGREMVGVRNFRMAVTLSPEDGGTQTRVEYTWDARWGIAWLFSLLMAGRVMGKEMLATLKNIEKAAPSDVSP